MFGLDYIIFRPHNVYGPRQNIGDRYRNVVGIFMNQILQGQPMTIFGDGTQTRAFSYIDDVAPVIADAIDTPPRGTRRSTSAPISRTRCCSWPMPLPRRWASRQQSASARRATKCSMCIRRTTRRGGIRRAAADAARRRTRIAWRHGYASTAPGPVRRSKGSRSPEICPAHGSRGDGLSRRRTCLRTRRAPSSGKSIAEHLAAWVPPERARARGRRRLLPMDQ